MDKEKTKTIKKWVKRSFKLLLFCMLLVQIYSSTIMLIDNKDNITQMSPTFEFDETNFSLTILIPIKIVNNGILDLTGISFYIKLSNETISKEFLFLLPDIPKGTTMDQVYNLTLFSGITEETLNIKSLLDSMNSCLFVTKFTIFIFPITLEGHANEIQTEVV
jgi:hypothetical protein